MSNKTPKVIQKLSEDLESWMDILITSLPSLVFAILVFLFAVVLSHGTKKTAIRVLSKSNLQQSMRQLIAQLAAILVIALGIVLVLGIFDLSKTLNGVLAGAGVLGLAVGLALQGALANVYSGIVLSYVDSIKYGDWIKTNNFEGEVVDINLRVVTLKKADNNLVYIPNKMVIENPIENYSKNSQSKVLVECGVAYDSDLNQVRRLVEQTIATNFPSVSSEEEVIFTYQDFGDSSINFQILFWIDSLSPLQIAMAKTEAIVKIKAVFDENKIEIPFPIRTLNIPRSEIIVDENKID